MVRRGYRTIRLPVKDEPSGVAIRTSARRADALEKIIGEMTLFDGVKLYDIMESIYLQGRKDGARAAFEAIDKNVAAVKKEIPHRPPGRPRKTR
jgi:hypothetical protein